MPGRRLSPSKSTGPVTIQTQGANPIHLQYPLEVSASKGVLVIVNEMPFEEYVAAVLAGEASGFRSDEVSEGHGRRRSHLCQPLSQPA